MLRFPEKLNQSIHIGLAADVFDSYYPGMPVHVAVLGCAGEIDRILLTLILPHRLIGRAVMHQFIALKCVRLVEDSYQLRYDHIMERALLHGAAARLCAPVHFEGCRGIWHVPAGR